MSVLIKDNLIRIYNDSVKQLRTQERNVASLRILITELSDMYTEIQDKELPLIPVYEEIPV